MFVLHPSHKALSSRIISADFATVPDTKTHQQVIHPWPRRRPRSRRPRCRPRYKKAQMKATVQEGPVASHITRRPRSQKELFDEPFTLLLLLHLHPQSFHQFFCLKEQFYTWLIKKSKITCWVPFSCRLCSVLMLKGQVWRCVDTAPSL